MWLCVVILLGLTPTAAAAQKDQFIEAVIEFHSELTGTYGDEGPRVAAALDKMTVTFGAWDAANGKAEAALRSGPAYAPSTLALFFLEAGRPHDALDAIDAALQVEPKRAGLHMFRGLLLEATGRETAALESFATAWALDPDDPIITSLHASRMSAGQASQDLERQIASLLAASQRAGASRRAPFIQVALIDDRAADMPRFAPAAYADGFAAFAAGRYEDAIARFRSVASRDPLVADPVGQTDLVRQGVAALRNGLAAEAIAHFEATVAHSPSSSEAHRILGVAHAATGNVDASVEHLTAAIRLAAGDERARVALGRVLTDAGRADEAERVLRDAIALLPASGRARWALADLHQRLGRGAETIDQLEEAAALPVPAGKGRLLWRLADVSHQVHDYERVVSALERRTRLMPNDADAHKGLGMAYRRAGRNGQALIELLTASLLGLEDAETLAATGQLLLNAGRAGDAESVLRRAVALAPESPEARYAFGRTLIRLGRTDEGRLQLSEFAKLRAAEIEQRRRTIELEMLKHAADLDAPESKK